MQVAGVICEYNPFHTGHARQLAELRRRGAEAIVCCMAGNFTQRGDFALVRKHARAEAAVRGINLRDARVLPRRAPGVVQHDEIGFLPRGQPPRREEQAIVHDMDCFHHKNPLSFSQSFCPNAATVFVRRQS